MIQCKECGTELPEEARFCLHCGSPVPVKEADEPELSRSEPPPPPPPLDFLQPSVAGGIVLGLLSSIPIINAGNCICCMWVLGGGAVAAYLLIRQRPEPGAVTYGDAAFVGVMSGLFGALLSTVISIPVKRLGARFLKDQSDSFASALRDAPELDGPMRDLLLRAVSPEISATTVLFTFFSDLILYSLFAMIGAIILVAIYNKRGGRFRQPASQRRGDGDHSR